MLSTPYIVQSTAAVGFPEHMARRTVSALVQKKVTRSIIINGCRLYGFCRQGWNPKTAKHSDVPF